jgi:hypothetical protein
MLGISKYIRPLMKGGQGMSMRDFRRIDTQHGAERAIRDLNKAFGKLQQQTAANPDSRKLLNMIRSNVAGFAGKAYGGASETAQQLPMEPGAAQTPYVDVSRIKRVEEMLRQDREDHLK